VPKAAAEIYAPNMSCYKIFVWLFLIFLSVGNQGYNANADDLQRSAPAVAGMNVAKLEQAGHYAAGSGCVVRGGKIVFNWGDIDKHYELKSTTKSIGVTALGLAIKDGRVGLREQANKYYSSLGIPPDANNVAGWLDKISLLNLATHTAGFDKKGGYGPLLFEPATAWAYSDGGPNWLADCLTVIYGQDLKDLMFDRVFTPLGIRPSDLTWRDHAYREKTVNGVKRREFASGIRANVKAMVRIGLLYLKGGKWDGRQILPESFVDSVRTPVAEFADLPVGNDRKSIFQNAPKHYGLLWWNNADGALHAVPRDAYWSWGLYDSLMVVIPSLDIVVARAGPAFPGRREPNFYGIIERFLEPITTAVNDGAPYPNSPVISNIIWDDATRIVRKAPGSDNWPITWADDDRLYTAYGDGFGFDPKMTKKKSMGFAKVEGRFSNFTGTNIPSPDEQLGHGRTGKKASGMLMVDGILYKWVRNIDGKGNRAQLAWSDDYGKSWQWNSWRFDAFGYCTFINYGKNYDGARDHFVYTVTHDNPSAYDRADRFVLMRVPKDRIRNREFYEFFEKIDLDGKPKWTRDIKKRGAVFAHPNKCHRSGISYNASLKRYLWWQAKYRKNEDGKQVGRFGVFDAPEPWGPWTTVYYTENWDVAAGETGSFPPKWMSKDGKTIHLVFSGNDAFSVRKATLRLAPDACAK
jgi:CubicO group peptidase (beta-lactamase class C family)